MRTGKEEKVAAGYSSRSLVEKLGIKESFRAVFFNPPSGYRALLGPLPEGVEVASKPDGLLDFIQLFTTERHGLEKRIQLLKKHLAPNGVLWVSWPKMASRVRTDLNENVVREVALKNGLVDVKVCAVDETWSGLKLVYRLKDRQSGAGNRSSAHKPLRGSTGNPLHTLRTTGK